MRVLECQCFRVIGRAGRASRIRIFLQLSPATSSF